MKQPLCNITLSLVCLIAFISPLSAAVLSNLSYSQRLGTKLVDIKYDLSLANGEAANIELFFSFDDGKTFPIPCSSLSGDAGPYVLPGRDKKVTWDAGKDWNHKYTSNGKIRIRSSVAEKIDAIPFKVVSVPFNSSNIELSPSWGINQEYTSSRSRDVRSLNDAPTKPPVNFHVDRYEVTNHQWNLVSEWARGNGYDLESIKFKYGEENFPCVNIPIHEVVKWLNARSEMEGMTPVYYVDPVEWGFDENGDGKFSLGTDSLYPSHNLMIAMENGNFDWSLVANPGHSLDHQAIKWDPNQNGRWDQGEPFIDHNRDAKFQPLEFADFNKNNKRDKGLSIVYRTGNISTWFNGFVPPIPHGCYDYWNLFLHTKESANGYRLPNANWLNNEFYFLAMGGRPEQGIFQTFIDYFEIGSIDPTTGEWIQPMKTGVKYVEEWPWGNESPNQKSDIGDYAVTPFGSNPASGIQSVGRRKPNGYQLHDMIGNAEELTMEWSIEPSWDEFGTSRKEGKTTAFGTVGGSWNQIPYDSSFSDGYVTELTFTPSRVLATFNRKEGSSAPEVGFRAIRAEF